MKVVKFIFLISAIILLVLYFCRETIFIKKHSVILVTYAQSNGEETLTNEAKEFEKKHQIKLKEAMEIISKYEKNNLNADSNFYPSLIIDDYYVYSFRNLKTSKVATFGIGINADTGNIKKFTGDMWLNEKKLNHPKIAR